MMVAQVGESPAAFLFWISTWPGSFSFSASIKPSVAASRATWGASWQMPTTYFTSPAGSLLFSGAALDSLGSALSKSVPEQAARDRVITSASSSAVSFAVFFILYSSKRLALLLCAAKVPDAKE